MTAAVYYVQQHVPDRHTSARPAHTARHFRVVCHVIPPCSSPSGDEGEHLPQCHVGVGVRAAGRRDARRHLRERQAAEYAANALVTNKKSERE